MRPTAPNPSRPRPKRTRRPRFGYDSRWWGPEAAELSEAPSYWSVTRLPIPCLLFILPLIATYELGILFLSDTRHTPLRTGIDFWIRQGLHSVGITDVGLPPLMLILGLLAWQSVRREPWQFRPSCLGGMALESLALALVLIGLSQVVEFGLGQIEQARAMVPLQLDPARLSRARLIGYLGAGVYEEAVFRLALIPLIMALLRLLLVPNVLAGALAVTGSALLFSVAHHAGSPGEAFSWFVFFFRWTAGIFFAWVFVARGFGIAAGTHAAYDILVGSFDWPG